MNTTSMWGDKPYYSLDYYLKERFGEKIYKIALDVNMTCPNRDGTLDTRGCIFCSAGGSGELAAKYHPNIGTQIENGIASYTRKEIGNRYIAYFQSYTNTYAPIPTLRSLYRDALSHPKVVGISIATRPDCLGEDVLHLLAELQQEFPHQIIWVELGLQTIHEKTATYIRRGYSLPVFTKAVEQLAKIRIPIVVHTILGLPFETTRDILATIHYLNTLPIMGIKLQLLHVLEGTDLASAYYNKEFTCMTLEEYITLLLQCIEHLSPQIVIHRITGDGPKELLIAPTWSLGKRTVLNTTHNTMKRNHLYQGRLYNGS
ncbi:MAG: TIGR01212 family radical SAM protein [Eubacteriales bacterium]